MTRIRLGYGHVVPGQALPFDILNTRGKILLSHGYVLQDQEQIDRLVEREVYFELIDEEAVVSHYVERVSLYQRVIDISRDYEALLDTQGNPPDFHAIPGIAKRLQEVCELDSDPALACILLYKPSRYSLRHGFNAAILTEILLKQMGRSLDERCYAMAGALTMDIAMLALQDTLYEQSDPLTPEQKRDLVLHPSTAAAMLRQQEVQQPIWLDVVEHHHEMIDGSGYAKRLDASRLSLEAQVVSLAERYCAAVSERGFRPARSPGAAARQLLTHQGNTIDTALAALFLREVCIYPPGCVVSLLNGEVAVVVKRTLHPATPVVRSIRAPSGVRHQRPPKRLTSKPAYGIQEVLGFDYVRGLDLASLWPRERLDEDDDEDAEDELLEG